MLTKFKKNIRKIPVVSGLAKLVYDWRQEKRLRKKVAGFWLPALCRTQALRRRNTLLATSRLSGVI